MNPDVDRIHNLLGDWLTARIDPIALDWVRARQAAITSGDKKSLYLAFGLTPRKVGKSDLTLSDDDLKTANSIRKDWNPRGWSVDQAVRTLLVLSFPANDSSTFASTLDQLFGAGEIGELVALYQALPLLPHPASHVLRAAEGIRSNIKAVFCAVAHQNPYPAEQFSEDQWNQMVLKCQFIGVPMSQIVGLDRRANANLARMVTDFVRERRAAKRPVAPEMWRCVGPFADSQAITDLQKLLSSASLSDQQAAALALSQTSDPAAKQILTTVPDLSQQISSGALSWDTIESNSI